MAQNNVINFKVFLRDSETTDTRRFSIDAPVVTNFMFLNEKLLSVFPVLREADYKITWKDSDGDEITIANDEDLITALTEMVGNIKMLFITILNKNEETREEPITLEADINVGRRVIICDVCERTIEGFRYNCLQCPDFDLCKDCEHKGYHREHLMVRMVNSDFFPRLNRRFVHDITRCIKRNIKSARKDSHKFTRYGQKGCESSQTKKCDEKLGESSENKTNEQQQQQQPPPFSGRCPFSGGQNNNNNYEGGCPFSSGERVNMEDFHNLGALARQHLDPILNMFSPPSSASGNSQGGAGEKPLLFDVIQNAVDGFFGRYGPQNPNQQQEQQQQKNTTPESADQTSNQKPASQETASATPMEQDQPTVPPQPQQQQQQQQQPTPQNQEKPAEPGWAFVAQNTQNPHPTSPSENNGSQQPAAPTPTIIYHSNPVIAEGLTRLHEMGFSNSSGILTQLLERHRGDVSEVVKALVDLKL
ncbi:sequestosome-1 [Agrilus planipennis]|uniref:Sequestosome-1 n=1 Tax=Agrilus planipennis TaxID=224129 RepID=A0A1W4XM66_AGRPL|nr:sequestosome-1 [Agrilus planipennis]